MSSPSPLPAEPVTDGAAHDELEITPAEPRQLFAEQRHALAPRAGHARDVGVPEHAGGTEGVVTTLRWRGRPARGPSHRDKSCQTRTLARGRESQPGRPAGYPGTPPPSIGT